MSFIDSITLEKYFNNINNIFIVQLIKLILNFFWKKKKMKH